MGITSAVNFLLHLIKQRIEAMTSLNIAVPMQAVPSFRVGRSLMHPIISNGSTGLVGTDARPDARPYRAMLLCKSMVAEMLP